jgi:hypothetical protein
MERPRLAKAGHGKSRYLDPLSLEAHTFFLVKAIGDFIKQQKSTKSFEIF